ncbi:MAG: DUF86 domain-containing protein [Candidatus Micrarchaeota archaeon]|nr:DUF86 domain-containing protein [Candidatus Micrarchaeota archaeon]
MKREYLDYLEDILESIKDIGDFTSSMSLADFKGDRKTINAVVRSLEIIGEASKKVPVAVQKKYPDVPWKKMAGMRDKLIHEYFGIDEEIVWKVARDEIPLVKPAIKKMLLELEGK